MRLTGIIGRLFGLVAAGAVGLVILCVVAGLNLQSSLLDDRIELTRHLDEEALSVVRTIQARAQKGEISEESAKETAKNTIRNLKYGDNEYFFIYDTHGTNVVHGKDQTREGKNFIDTADSNGKKYLADMISAATTGGGYVYYSFPRSVGGDSVPKVSYAVEFEPWGWVIGPASISMT